MTEEYIKKIKILISSGSLFLAIMGIIFFILKLIVLIFNISVNKPVLILISAIILSILIINKIIVINMDMREIK